MKLRRKWLGATGVMFAVSLALTGCSGGATGSTGGDNSKAAPRVAYFTTSATAQYNTAQWTAVQEAAKAAGGTAQMFDGGYDANKQLNQLQDAVTSRKFDILLISPLNGPALVPAAQEALDEGLAVVSLTNTISTKMDGLNSDVSGLIAVGIDLRENGRDIAGLMVDACKDLNPCKAAFLMGSLASSDEVPRTNAVKEVLAGHPNIQLVPDQEGGYFKQPGLDATNAVITAHPDINVIATVSTETTEGALQGLQDAGLAGKVKLVSNGGTVQDAKRIREGTFLGSAVVLPASEARMGTEQGIKKFKGEPHETVINSASLSPIGRLLTAASLNTAEGKAFVPEW
jgi:ribose transport system substrate-binding protein